HAGGRVVGLLGAAGRESGDEALLCGRERSPGEVRDREVPEEGWTAGEAEAFEVSAFDLFGDGVAGEEGEAEALAGGALDRLARAELPNARGTDPDRAELLIDYGLGARAGLAREQHELRQPAGGQLAVPQWREAGLRHPYDLVLEEGLELDAVVSRPCANERELDASAEQPVEDLAAC